LLKVHPEPRYFPALKGGLRAVERVNPVRNSSRAMNPVGIAIKYNLAAEQQCIISNGVDDK
jgi:hypothetical protein